MPRSVKRDCPVCGVTYDADATRLKHGRQSSCSRRCSYRLRASKLEQRVSLRCAVCDAEFTRSPKQVKGKHGAHFCSRRCHYAGRSLGLSKRVVTRPYVVTKKRSAEATRQQVATRRRRDSYRHSDETRARLREATAHAIAEGRIHTTSKLEDIVAEALTTLGVAFRRQVGLRDSRGRYAAVIDFMLSDGALEVNGTFWHSDPRVYPDGPAHPVQVRNAAAWSRKVGLLAARSIPLIVVWELDIRENAAQALLVALS